MFVMAEVRFCIPCELSTCEPFGWLFVPSDGGIALLPSNDSAMLHLDHQVGQHVSGYPVLNIARFMFPSRKLDILFYGYS